MSGHRERWITRGLACAALTLGLLAPLAGSPYKANHAAIDVAALARSVAREEDHVTALELAQWIKDRRPGLRVLDVRSAEDYDRYHLPTAERLALDSLATTPFHVDDTLVLYSEGGAHAAQAWVFLRALGYRNVYFLRGGLYEWLEQVMNPTLADTTPAGRDAFSRAALLSRYFGGVPRSDVRTRPADDSIALPGAPRAASAVPLPARTTAASIDAVRRRGC
jgi:rhodanese-related sulfurtransferase